MPVVPGKLRLGDDADPRARCVTARRFVFSARPPPLVHAAFAPKFTQSGDAALAGAMMRYWAVTVLAALTRAIRIRIVTGCESSA